METGGRYRVILSKNLREMSFLREARVVRFSEDSMKMYGVAGVEFKIMRRARFWRASSCSACVLVNA